MKRLFIILTLFILISCDYSSLGSEKFKHEVWVTADGYYQGQRKDMVKDLIKNHLEKGMNYNDILNLLGSPDKVDRRSITYGVFEDYGWDIDPIRHIDLHIKFDLDSTVVEYELIKTKVNE